MLNKVATKNLSRQQLRELVEYGFGVRCTGEVSDTTPSLRKL